MKCIPENCMLMQLTRMRLVKAYFSNKLLFSCQQSRLFWNSCTTRPWSYFVIVCNQYGSTIPPKADFDIQSLVRCTFLLTTIGNTTLIWLKCVCIESNKFQGSSLIALYSFRTYSRHETFHSETFPHRRTCTCLHPLHLSKLLLCHAHFDMIDTCLQPLLMKLQKARRFRRPSMRFCSCFIWSSVRKIGS